MTCPPAGLLAAMAEERLSLEEREPLLIHLADCDDCRRTLLMLATDRRATSRRVRVVGNRFPWIAMAASVALAAAAWVLWRTPRTDETAPPLVRQPVVPSPGVRPPAPPPADPPAPVPLPEPVPAPVPAPAPSAPTPAPAPSTRPPAPPDPVEP